MIAMSNVFYTARKTIKNLTQGGNALLVATGLALLVVSISSVIMGTL